MNYKRYSEMYWSVTDGEGTVEEVETEMRT